MGGMILGFVGASGDFPLVCLWVGVCTLKAFTFKTACNGVVM